MDDPASIAGGARPPHPVLETARALLSACSGAAFACGVLDVVRATLRADQAVPVRAFAWAVIASLGLYGGFALVAAALLGVVLGSARAALGEGIARRILARLQGDEATDRSVAAGLLAAGVAALSLGALVFGFARGFALEMASKRNGALSTALVAVAALPIAFACFFPAWLALRRAVGILPRARRVPRTVIALAGIAALFVGAVALAVLSVDWRVIDFGPFEALGAFALLVVVHLAIYGSRLGARVVARVPPALVVALRVLGPLSLGALLLVTLTSFGHDARSVALVGEETAGARPLLAAARRLFDRDHDGYAAILGGGDCDDHDADVNPGATDVPGDGIDQDCSGGDEPAVAGEPAGGDTAKAADGEPPSAKAGGEAKAAGEANGAAAAAAAWKGNLLLITIDTLRADRLNERTMPNVSAFAKDAVVFDDVYAQAPNTPRSFPSFLTSRFPSQIAWQKESLNFSPILDENTTFFEVLHAAGLRTVGEFSHFYLDRKNGVAQGFDEWDDSGALTLHDSNTDIAAPRITPKVIAKLAQLAKSKQRFALWTHYFEPHSRYMDHAEFPARGSGMKALEEKYDGEVRFVDEHIGRVLAALAKDGLDKDTAVFIFSDHGEAFGTHRVNGEQMYFHGQTLYDELLRVPLVARVPGVTDAARGRHVKERAMLVDLGPTVVDLVGAKAPAAFQGRSLVPALAGRPIESKPAWAELLPATSWQHNWRALIDTVDGEDEKIIDKLSENSVELYDLTKDPGEQKNLALSAPALTARMKTALRRYMGQVAAAAKLRPGPASRAAR